LAYFEQQSSGSEEEGDNQTALRSQAGFLRLNPESRLGILVTGVPPWCGATGNCSLWIFDAESGKELLDGNGWKCGLYRTQHHGLFDFYVRHNWSASKRTLQEHRFDGRVYQLSREIDEGD
jgi:hypothetical protein